MTHLSGLFPHPRTDQNTKEISWAAIRRPLIGDPGFGNPDGRTEQNPGGGQKSGRDGFFGGFGRIIRTPAVDSVHKNAAQCNLIGHVVPEAIVSGLGADCRVLQTASGQKRLLRFHGAALMPQE